MRGHLTRGSEPRDLHNLRIAYVTIAVVCMTYIFSFTFTPPSLLAPMSVLLALCCITSFVIALGNREISTTNTLLIGSLFVIILINIADLIVYQPEGGVLHFIRNMPGLLIMTWAVTQRLYLPKFEQFLTGAAFFAGLACVSLPFINEPIFRSGVLRLGAITSEIDDLHPSAYLCVVVFFWLAAVSYYKRTIVVTGPMMLGLLVVQSGYKAEAAQVIQLFVIVGYLALAFIPRKWADRLTIVLPPIMLTMLAGFFAYLWATRETWDIYMGSGRIGTWIDRISRLTNRDALELAFGLGPRSDFYFGTLTWMTKALHSHNDYLTVALEIGLVGLAAYVVFITAMVRASPLYLRIFIMIAILAPFFSGGILFKPTVAPLMALVTVHTMMMHEKRRRSLMRDPRSPNSIRKNPLSAIG